MKPLWYILSIWSGAEATVMLGLSRFFMAWHRVARTASQHQRMRSQ
jgi:hypothetical protein